MDALELWGGPECTVNRVGGGFGDQLVMTGHHHRETDLDLIAALGCKAIRYPVLWERVSPDDPDAQDWAWSDRRMQGLKDRAVRPIVGLVHHGSGPRYTDLLAANFATGLAKHARAVVERYPWVRDWTPVNEPCTTARFSCLYGHWYPHRKDERSFWLALINQIDATRLAMREIRSVTADARLIQTDDLGRTYATAAVRDQAAFDNLRRWAGWDLLAGRVLPEHPLWDRICSFGLGDRLRAIADDPCPADVIGINHYLTSDRFLDHRLQRYPSALWGGNTQADYVDTEAVRVMHPPPSGIAGVAREAWERYSTPIAITEAHNGCTREEQMRWTYDVWRAAQDLRSEGVDIRAVTSWALFGCSGWNTLLTSSGTYEPGVYDVGSGEPRATAMVPLLQALAAAREPAHPVLQGAGWWRRPIRLHHPTVPRPARMRDHLRAPLAEATPLAPPILIVGATGTLGQAIAAACDHRHIVYHLSGRSALDLGDAASIEAALDAHRPWVVINAAGWVRVDEAEASPQACMETNADGAIRLARACDARGIASISFSSDLVFGGDAGRPYVESDAPAPLGAYGRSKAAMEEGVGRLAGRHLIVRTAAFFSPFDPHNFAVHVVEALAQRRRFAASGDHVVSPTYVPDLCNAVLDLAIDGERGIWHLAGDEPLSWAEFARRIACGVELDPDLVTPATGAALGWTAPRPACAALDTVRGRMLPPPDQAIARFAAEMRANGPLRADAAA